MNHDKSYAFRLFLYLFGLVIIVLAAIFWTIPFLMIWQSVYFWLLVLSVYLIMFLPFVIDILSETSRNFVFTGGIVYYRGAIIYTVIALILMWLDLSGLAGMRFLYIGFLTALFVYLVYVYLACIAGSHTENVIQHNQEKKAVLDEVKFRTNSLVNIVENNQDDHLQSELQKIQEDIRYISPSDDPRAADLEYQILDLIDDLTSAQNEKNHENRTEDDLKKLKLAVKQRKSIY